MQAIHTVYLGATSNRAARIKAIAEGGMSIIDGIDYELDGEARHWKAAQLLIKKLGWTDYNWASGGAACNKRGYVFVPVTSVNTWNPNA